MSDPNDNEPRPNAASIGRGGGDVTAAVIRAVVSNIPIVGQAISEIVAELIPNQRIERLEKYLLYLGEECATLQIDVASMKKPANIDLIEDGAFLAARALTDDRKRRLAHAVAHGIAARDQDKINEKRVLSIIGEPDDGDLLLLEAHAPRSLTIFDTIRPERPVAGSPDPVQQRWQLYEASISRLERLGLLHNWIRVDHETELPKFDRFTGEAIGTIVITALGRLVLHNVGLLDETTT